MMSPQLLILNFQTSLDDEDLLALVEGGSRASSEILDSI